MLNKLVTYAYTYLNKYVFFNKGFTYFRLSRKDRKDINNKTETTNYYIFIMNLYTE